MWNPSDCESISSSESEAPPPDYDIAIVLSEDHIDDHPKDEAVIDFSQTLDRFHGMGWQPNSGDHHLASHVPTYNYVPSSLQSYKQLPVHITCQHCGFIGTTEVKNSLKKKEACCLFAFSLIMCSWICCLCLYPFCHPKFKISTHICPKCHNVLGTYDPAAEEEE